MKVRFEKSFGPNLWDELSMVNSIQGVTIPGLLFHDSNDDVVPWQDGESVARAWNNARFIKTTGLGHRRILRDRNVIESAVRFLNDSKLPLGF
jgi:pimeloyl-ACP methyl ester carboxylesterase